MLPEAFLECWGQIHLLEIIPLHLVELDRAKTAVRDKCGPAGIRLWDESTAGVNDHTLNTVSCKSLWPCCPLGQASTAHTTASLRPCIGHIATCALLLGMMYVTGTKVLANPAPQQSCDISPALPHPRCWRRPHPPGDVSSAPSISPPSSRRCKLCSWHLFSGLRWVPGAPSWLLALTRSHQSHPWGAAGGTHSTLLQGLFAAPVLGRQQDPPWGCHWGTGHGGDNRDTQEPEQSRYSPIANPSPCFVSLG